MGLSHSASALRLCPEDPPSPLELYPAWLSLSIHLTSTSWGLRGQKDCQNQGRGEQAGKLFWVSGK